MQNMSVALILFALSSASITPAFADSPVSTDPFSNMDRAQNLVANLNKVAGSSGFYLLQDIRNIKEMDHDLTKARRQVEEVDKTFGRLRGNPDQRKLQAAVIKIEKALNTRAMLEEDLRDAYTTLKASIQETLVTDVQKPKDSKESKDSKAEKDSKSKDPKAK
jgi:nitrogen regulatory protein PII-like uncharacterized protein